MAYIRDNARIDARFPHALRRTVAVLTFFSSLALGVHVQAQTLVSVEVAPNDLARMTGASPNQILAVELELIAALGEAEFVGTNVAGGPVLAFPESVTFEQAKTQIESRFKEPISDEDGQLVPAQAGAFTPITSLNAELSPAAAEGLLARYPSFKQIDPCSGAIETPLTFTTLATGRSGIPSVFLRELSATAGATFAEPNYKLRPMERLPSEFPAPDLVHPRMGVPSVALKSIDAPVAWDAVVNTTKGVAVIDTGIDYDHPDIAANMWQLSNSPRSFGFDFYDSDSDAADEVASGGWHGTAVASVIGAVANNGEPLVGVAWKVPLMSLRVAGGARTDDGWSTNHIACAIYFAVERGADIINASFGGPNDSKTLRAAVEAATMADKLIVAAAGNSRGSVDERNNDARSQFPASYSRTNKRVIAVASVNPADKNRLSEFSHFGSASVQLGAPGQGILSAYPGGTPLIGVEGTSLAAPHVSGALALTWGHDDYKDYDALQIRDLLLRNGQMVASLKDKTTTGCTLNLSFLAGKPLGHDCSEPEPPASDDSSYPTGTSKFDPYTWFPWNICPPPGGPFKSMMIEFTSNVVINPYNGLPDSNVWSSCASNGKIFASNPIVNGAFPKAVWHLGTCYAESGRAVLGWTNVSAAECLVGVAFCTGLNGSNCTHIPSSKFSPNCLIGGPSFTCP